LKETYEKHIDELVKLSKILNLNLNDEIEKYHINKMLK
jgi:hypothetical protein